MTSETDSAEKAPSGISRRGVVTGAAWSVPVIALAVAAPAASASGTPTDISVTLQPTPPKVGQPLRLTYRGTSGFDFVPFPAGSTATVVISGTFTGTLVSGATVTTTSGTNPVTRTLTITNLDGFYVQGTGQNGSSVSVTVYDGGGAEIGSDFTTIGTAG
ncbi:hypothetical protein [Subtercola lobariae]|uniref:Uncharacterized protein n=1 Tax=Subtercola lobariae TaxID=1588641 RepID=A0A917B946_9MICO|nr:hypothetical protein [Subtercola lobariae]GGF31024.1 hypothetical protein GCM10011399_25300 [Subtercola lobariae]